MIFPKYFRTGRYRGSLRHKSTLDKVENTSTDKGSLLYSSELTSPPDMASTEKTNICELCEEEPIDVRFLPCEHAVICGICARRATKCIKCKVRSTIQSLYSTTKVLIFNTTEADYMQEENYLKSRTDTVGF